MKKEMKRIVKIVAHRVMHSKSKRKITVEIIVNDIILALDDALSFFSDDVILRAAELCYVHDRLVESSDNVLMLSEISFVTVEKSSFESIDFTFVRDSSVVISFVVESSSIAIADDFSSELFELTDLFDVEMN
jgi:hypothetical protein